MLHGAAIARSARTQRQTRMFGPRQCLVRNDVDADPQNETTIRLGGLRGCSHRGRLPDALGLDQRGRDEPDR